ncbi:hypothetical protein K8556_19875 [Corallococcus sp. AS-1-12]|nr:hypothetical protein [Corallococcus sp. AS-1-12]
MGASPLPTSSAPGLTFTVPLTVMSPVERSTLPLGRVSVPAMLMLLNWRLKPEGSEATPAGVERSTVWPTPTLNAPAEPSP